MFRDNLADGPDSETFRFAFHVHGNGGVGKTSLVRQWEREAAQRGAVTAYTDEGVHSSVEAMALVADALRQQGAELKTFDKLLARYRQRQHEATGALAVPSAGGDDASSGSPAGPGQSPLAVTGARLALAGASMLPGVAPFAGAVDAAQAAEAMERARSMLTAQFRSHEDVQLVLSPERALTPVLVADLAAVAARHPYVMVTFDTWEQTRPVLDAWLRALVLDGTYGDLPLNVVTVTAGRERLGGGWRDTAEQIGLDVFTEDEARQLLSAKGVVDESLVQRILRISGRLPVLVAMLAQGGPAGGGPVDDAADTAVELFLKWETDPARRAAALLCALPLHLNEDIFHAALADPPPDGYAWLRGLAFVTEQDGRLRYHDIVRRTMLRLQRARAPRRWSADHERLAAVFRGWRVGHETGLDEDDLWHEADWQDALLHETFHSLCAHPRQALPGAVDPLVRACGQSLAALRRWVQMVDDAARSSEHEAVTSLARRLVQATATDAPDTMQALGILLTVPGISPRTRALALSLRGRRYRDDGRYDDAVTDYSAALGLQPDLARAHAGRGETYRVCGRHEEALADFDRAIEIDPDKDWAIASRAQVHTAQGRHPQALADYSRAIEIDPEYSWAIAQRGSVYDTLGDYAAALADYSRAIEIDPEYSWAIAQRGSVHDTLGDHVAALADYSRAIEIDPDKDWAIASRAQVHTVQGRHPQALADYSRAIEIDPEYSWAIAQRGTVYQARGDFEAALADYNRAVEIDPEYSWAIAQRGTVYQARGDFEAALADYNRAIALDPSVVALRGLLHQAMGHHGDALADYDRAVELSPADATAFALRGILHQALGRFDEARADRERTVELVPADNPTFMVRGLLHQAMGHHGDALADYDRAVELSPADATVFALRGILHQALGRLDEARADCERALEINPESELGLVLRGIGHRETGRLGEALADFDRAFRINAKLDEFLGLRGETLLAMGHYEDAFADLERASVTGYINPWRDYLKALAVRRLGLDGADELLSGALDQYRLLIAQGVSPEYSAANLVLVHSARGDWEAAQTQVTALRDLIPLSHVYRRLQRNLSILADVFPVDVEHVDRLQTRLAA